MRYITILKKIISRALVYIIILLATIWVIYNDMVISPKYPLVYSQYNQSILYLIGRMMKAGSIPYIDVIDHKGIYVLLIHYIAVVIGENNHIGLFIIGVLFNFVSALYIYKIIIKLNEVKINYQTQKNRTDSKSKKNILVDEIIVKITAIFISLVYVVLQSLYVISYGTMQSETFITTLIVISIYYFVNDVIKNNYKFIHTLLYGIIFSCILFIKANYDLYFLSIAILIFINCIKYKKFYDILNHIMYGTIGIIIGIAPGIIYAIKNNNLKEMFYYSFFVNAIYSNAPYMGLNTKAESVLWTLSRFFHVYMIILVGMIVCIVVNAKFYKNAKLFKIYMYMLFISFLLIISTLVSARDYSYYLIVLLPFIIFLLYEIFKCIFTLLSKTGMTKFALYIILISLLITFLVKLNLKYGRDLMVKNGKEQLKVASDIKDVYNDSFYGIKKNLLVLGSEIYLYDYMNILPSFKYFAVPMIGYNYYKEPYVETLKYIDGGDAGILVVGVGAGFSEFYNNTNIVEIINNNYSLVLNTYGRQVLKHR